MRSISPNASKLVATSNLPPQPEFPTGVCFRQLIFALSEHSQTSCNADQKRRHIAIFGSATLRAMMQQQLQSNSNGLRRRPARPHVRVGPAVLNVRGLFEPPVQGGISVKPGLRHQQTGVLQGFPFCIVRTTSHCLTTFLRVLRNGCGMTPRAIDWTTGWQNVSTNRLHTFSWLRGNWKRHVDNQWHVI